VRSSEIPVETEIKLRFAGPEEARQAVLRMGATPERGRHLEDNQLLDFEDMRLRIVGSVLRVRTAEGSGILTFKGPRRVVGGLKSREEIESAVTDPRSVLEVLHRLGLRPSFRYQKYREVFSWKGQELVVDETPIGTFIEIEGDASGIQAAAEALGRTPEDYISESYAAIFLSGGGSGDMVFP
jgi:adenylate cyclase class 2